MFKILLFLLRLVAPVLVAFIVVKILAWRSTGWLKKTLNAFATGLLWLLVPLLSLKALTMWLVHQS